MYQLFYLSNAVEPMSDEALDALLTQARQRNAQHAVTGMLVYHEGSFLQILEGEKADVTAVFNSINKDARHNSIILVDEVEVDQRSFSDWSMAFKKITQEELQQYPVIKQLLTHQDGAIGSYQKPGDLVDVFLNLIVN